MERIDTVVIGAGVVGLAIARELAMRGREVVILERASAFGTETSARNSEVIHAGLYYEPGSLKARLCVEGRSLLYAFAVSHGVAHRRCGKLIVATGRQQEASLAAIAARATACGVHDLTLLSRAKAHALEPAVACTAALLSPSTGIVDTHGLMLALLGDAEDHGAMLSLDTEVVQACGAEGGFVLQTRNAVTGEVFSIRATCVVNAAGLRANDLALRFEGLPAGSVPKLHFAKGNYFTASVRPPFTRLIYPVPEPGGLGIHLTLDLSGAARFGPDVEWCDSVNYIVDAALGAYFADAIRRYWPGLPDGQLQPAFCGVRPKLSGPGEAAADFHIDQPLPGLVNLFGIESPGLTSSLAIARYVAAML